MVDGKTIEDLRKDLNSVIDELNELKSIVSTLEQKTKIIDTLDIESLNTFVQSRTHTKNPSDH